MATTSKGPTPTITDLDDAAIIDFHRPGVPKIKLTAEEYMELYEKMGEILEDESEEPKIRTLSPMGFLVMASFGLVLFVTIATILRWFNF